MTQIEINDLLTREFELTFVDKATGEKTTMKAPDAILATLRAHSMNPNLTFDVNAIDRSEGQPIDIGKRPSLIARIKNCLR